jgi:hypothetical protein
VLLITSETQDVNLVFGIGMKLGTYFALREEHTSIETKAIPVTGRGDLKGCDILRIAHCLDNRLTDGGKIVSPTHLPRFIPQKHYCCANFR